MAVHNSPLAEPKNVFFGHTLSALSGVIIYALMGASAISLGIAVGLSVFVMSTFGAIHPPAGANPIIAILGGKGLSFVLMPVALGALFIIIFALCYNKLLKRNYP
jgi:CBS-domain-containing membrane protein